MRRTGTLSAAMLLAAAAAGLAHMPAAHDAPPRSRRDIRPKTRNPYANQTAEQREWNAAVDAKKAARKRRA